LLFILGLITCLIIILVGKFQVNTRLTFYFNYVSILNKLFVLCHFFKNKITNHDISYINIFLSSHCCDMWHHMAW